MKNALNRELPDFIEGYGKVRPYTGLFEPPAEGARYAARPIKMARPNESKVVKSLKDLFKTIPIKDGMTISFHHALRNGDFVINMVLDVAAELGIKDLTVAPSGLFDCHEPIVGHMKSGVVTGFHSAGIVGTVGGYVSRGALKNPIVVTSHGGRARALYNNDIKVDVAFVAAPTADIYGNINGCEGPSACGSLGYALSDVDCADYVVAVTDNLQQNSLSMISATADKIDYVVPVDKIGDPKGIVYGVLKITRDPLQLLIAEMAVKATDAMGLIKNGYSFQTGGGGVSLAFAKYIADIMRERKLVASHAMGGITKFIVDMLEEGTLKTIYDNQCFDLVAVESMRKNANHIEVSASHYANPYNAGPIVNTLDQCILGALEIDTNFNLNVLTGSDGILRFGIGGNPDTAAGSKVSMVTANLLRGRLPVVMDEVTTVCTPGESVDVIVTEEGIAVNPLRPELKDMLTDAKLPVVSIEELRDKAYKMAGKPDKLKFKDKIIGVVESREGTVLDVVRQIDED